MEEMSDYGRDTGLCRDKVLRIGLLMDITADREKFTGIWPLGFFEEGAKSGQPMKKQAYYKNWERVHSDVLPNSLTHAVPDIAQLINQGSTSTVQFICHQFRETFLDSSVLHRKGEAHPPMSHLYYLLYSSTTMFPFNGEENQGSEKCPAQGHTAKPFLLLQALGTLVTLVHITK